MEHLALTWQSSLPLFTRQKWIAWLYVRFQSRSGNIRYDRARLKTFPFVFSKDFTIEDVLAEYDADKDEFISLSEFIGDVRGDGEAIMVTLKQKEMVHFDLPCALICRVCALFFYQRIRRQGGRSRRPCGSRTCTIRTRTASWIGRSNSAGLHPTATVRPERR